MTDTAHLKALGTGATKYNFERPDAAVLETFANPIPQTDEFSGVVNITCPEFTSLCPITGQPDFATIVIEYMPRKLCVESKSLKLYLMGYRNSGEFHESCVAHIAQHLVTALDPMELMVRGEFTPRGGIPFWPAVHYVRSDDYDR